MVKVLQKPWTDKNYGRSYFVCETKNEIPFNLLKVNDRCYEINSGIYYKFNNDWEVDTEPIYIKIANDIRVTNKEARENGI